MADSCLRSACTPSTSSRAVAHRQQFHGAVWPLRWPARHNTSCIARRVGVSGHGLAGVDAAAALPIQQRSVCCAALAGAASDNVVAANHEPTVEEVMNPHPTVLQADMSIKDAVQVLLDKDISGAPVVDGSAKLVGVLSESDIIWKGAGVPQDHYLIPPVFLGFADAFIAIRDNPKIEQEVHKILAKTVKEAMTSKVEVAKPSMPMSDAASLMLAKQINMLPVVDGGRVVGVLTRHDVLRGIYASKSPFL